MTSSIVYSLYLQYNIDFTIFFLSNHVYYKNNNNCIRLVQLLLHSFFLQVKDLLDDALKERSMVWDNKMRLGIDEEPALGFPSLDEIGKNFNENN